MNLRLRKKVIRYFSTVLAFCFLLVTECTGVIIPTLIVQAAGLTLTVDKNATPDGTTTFNSISSAITYLSNNKPTSEATRAIINIKAGTYKEKMDMTIPYVTFQGDTTGETKLTFDASNQTVNPADPNGGNYGSGNCAALIVDATDFNANNITFENSHLKDYGIDSQAACVQVMSDRATFVNCKFYSGQDVLNINYNRSYYKNCYIEGAVDSAWGLRSKALFDGCTFNIIRAGAAYTAGGDPACYWLLNNCKFTAVPNQQVIDAINKIGGNSSAYSTITGVMFGRTWYPGLHVCIRNSTVTAPLSPTAWSSMSASPIDPSCELTEYKNVDGSGNLLDTSHRNFAVQLSDANEPKYNMYDWLKATDGWDPTNQAAYYTELNNVANALAMNNLQNVATNLDLPTSDASSGATMKWFSSNTNLISNTGVVNRPAFDGENQNLTLTAVVTKNGREVAKDFILTVLKSASADTSDPDYIACLDAYNALMTSTIPALNLSALKNDFTLPTTGIEGTTLEWKSNNLSITDAGKVSRPAATTSDSTGTLQLTIRKNSAAKAYYFDTKVIKFLLPTAGLYKPIDFVGANIGNPAPVAGTSSFSSVTKQFSVTGNGTGFTKTLVDNDQFYFDGVLMTGDFTISAKITNFTNSSPSFGLTIRDSLDPLSYHVTQGITTNKGRIMYRYSGKASGSTGTATVSGTAYQQLTKVGSVITSIISDSPITSSPVPSTNTVISTISASGLGVDANGNQKEIYTDLVISGGISANFQDVRIVTSTGTVVFDSNVLAPTVTITSVTSPSAITVTQGNSVTLPTTVTANYSDGTQKSLPVQWNGTVDTNTVGIQTIQGIASGYSVTVSVKVNVIAVVKDFTVNSSFNLSSLAPGKMLEAVTTVTNNKSSLQNVLVIVALYDGNGKMVNMSYISKNIPIDDIENLTAGFKLPSDTTNYTAKIFVWDGTGIETSTMQPISNVVTLQ